MASGTFKVFTDRVEGLADRMDTLSGEFELVSHGGVRYSGLADASPVDDGLHEFFGKWTDGMDKIHKQLDGLADRLHEAARAYDVTEQAIIEAESPS